MHLILPAILLWLVLRKVALEDEWTLRWWRELYTGEKHDDR